MHFASAEFPGHSEARHSEGWYGNALRDTSLRHGDRMFIRCEGGPCTSRLEVFPPRIEIHEKNGFYVLVDEGPPESWTYQFVASGLNEACIGLSHSARVTGSRTNCGSVTRRCPKDAVLTEMSQ
jgi:hypothetical protein